MAFSQTHRTHRCATEHTVFANGLGRIFGAAWEEATALTEHRTNAVLIGPDEPQRSGAGGVANSEASAGLKRLLVHATAPKFAPEPDFELATLTVFVAANFAMSRSSAFVHSAITAPTSLVVITLLKRTTYCEGGNAVCRRRNCSRMRRLTVLRNTDVRAFFLPIIMPSRGRTDWGLLPISARR